MQVLEGDVGQQWRIEVDGAAGGVFKTEGGADDPGGNHAVERIALETCHRINRATPVTVTAVVCPALLAADRSLTVDEVLGTVAPLAELAYVAVVSNAIQLAADTGRVITCPFIPGRLPDDAMAAAPMVPIGSSSAALGSHCTSFGRSSTAPDTNT